jgi:hypothetical protein
MLLRPHCATRDDRVMVKKVMGPQTFERFLHES